MKTRFDTARIAVTLQHPGEEPVEVWLHAPYAGWVNRLEAVYVEPVQTINTPDGKGGFTKSEEKATDAQIADWHYELMVLKAGKCLALSGELEQAYPDPLPTDRGALQNLAKSIMREFHEANLRDADILALAKGANRLNFADLTKVAPKLGNDSPAASAT